MSPFYRPRREPGPLQPHRPPHPKVVEDHDDDAQSTLAFVALLTMIVASTLFAVLCILYSPAGGAP